MAPSTKSPHNRLCCSALRDGSGNAQLHVGSSWNAPTRIATTSSRSWGDATRGLRSSAAIHSTPTVAGQSSRADQCHGSQRRTPKPSTGDSYGHVFAQRDQRQLGGAPSEISQDKAPAHRHERALPQAVASMTDPAVRVTRRRTHIPVSYT